MSERYEVECGNVRVWPGIELDEVRMVGESERMVCVSVFGDELSLQRIRDLFPAARLGDAPGTFRSLSELPEVQRFARSVLHWIKINPVACLPETALFRQLKVRTQGTIKEWGAVRRFDLEIFSEHPGSPLFDRLRGGKTD